MPGVATFDEIQNAISEAVKHKDADAGIAIAAIAHGRAFLDKYYAAAFEASQTLRSAADVLRVISRDGDIAVAETIKAMAIPTSQELLYICSMIHGTEEAIARHKANLLTNHGIDLRLLTDR